MRVADRPWLLRGAVLGLALTVGLVSWAVSGDDEEATPPAPEVRAIDAAELGNLAALTDHAVYWAGPMPGTELELTESADGSVQLRYLRDASERGRESAQALTIGSYPLPDPAGALATFAAEPDAVARRSRQGVEVVASRSNPSSVYFASPDNSVQVEVYDPVPGRALGLALSGRVRPVG